jgi:UDP-N-acetylmuramoyl-L-alanyl-D-glutamate--2,6-diaminopimelate ligase
MQQLSKLLKNSLDIDCNIDCSITDLILNSQKVTEGALFFACVGSASDGRKFIDEAIARGAAAILCEKDHQYTTAEQREYQGKGIPIIPIEELHKKVGFIAAEFYGHPSKSLRVIGVTGTNGKTSCCHFIAHALQSLGYRTAIIGTVGNGLYGHLHIASHTTPNSIELQKMLADFKSQAVETVAMEVSSHGLDQGRLNGVNFDVAIFTNLTRDHLDYHHSMEAYGEAKAKLFNFPDLKYTVINMDDEFGRRLLDLPRSSKQYGYSASGRLANGDNIAVIRAHDVHLSMQGITAAVHTPWGDGVLHSKLLGRFNLSNLLATMTTLGIYGIPLSQSLKALTELDTVSGRMQVLGGHGKPYVVIDYAHTPDALRQVISTLREFCENEIWCVFGCGGNRDQGKRPLMGEIAESYVDHIVITNDNPRHENPLTIISDILSGMKQPAAAIIETDRERAIYHAISCANRDDIILIAGKGHEAYQQINDEKKPFSDYMIAQLALAKI